MNAHQYDLEPSMPPVEIGQTVHVIDCLAHAGKHDDQYGRVSVVNDDSTITVLLKSGEPCVAAQWRIYRGQEQAEDSPPLVIKKRRGRRPKQQQMPLPTPATGSPEPKPSRQSSPLLTIEQPTTNGITFTYHQGSCTVEARNLTAEDLDALTAYLRAILSIEQQRGSKPI